MYASRVRCRMERRKKYRKKGKEKKIRRVLRERNSTTEHNLVCYLYTIKKDILTTKSRFFIKNQHVTSFLHPIHSLNKTCYHTSQQTDDYIKNKVNNDIKKKDKITVTSTKKC